MTTTNETRAAFDRAFDRAFLLNPAVVWAGGLEYFVSGTSPATIGDTYHVVLTDNVPMVSGAGCTFKAGELGLVACIHRAAAYILFIEQDMQKVGGFLHNVQLPDAVAMACSLVGAFVPTENVVEVAESAVAIRLCDSDGCRNEAETDMGMCQSCYNDWFECQHDYDMRYIGFALVSEVLLPEAAA